MIPECFFCHDQADYRMVIAPNNILREQVFEVCYAGGRYPACKACGEFWNKGLKPLQEAWNDSVTKLFNETKTRGKEKEDARQNKPAQ